MDTIYAFVEPRVVEVKVRTSYDGLTWETRPVVLTVEVVTGETEDRGARYVVVDSPKVGLLETLTKKVKKLRKDAVEFRWNFQGVDQGHYNFVR